MAQKKKVEQKPKAEKKPETKITRIKANDTGEDKPVKAKVKAEAPKSNTKLTLRDNQKGFIGYLKGAWHELKQVRWPNRRTAWGLTLAVIVFTAFFTVLIILLDAGFKLLFDKIILK